MEEFNSLITAITDKSLQPSVNLDRPIYIQPEDRIQYRATRIVLILGSLNTKFGLSKNVIACVDFLLRNSTFQNKFILEYFAGNKNLVEKLSQATSDHQLEIDFNIVQYKSVPWDIRFNDIFLYLYVRDLISIRMDANNKNVRLLLTTEGKKYHKLIDNIFPDEVNFLELFGTRLSEDKTIEIITNVIPNSYWKQNVEINNK